MSPLSQTAETDVGVKPALDDDRRESNPQPVVTETASLTPKGNHGYALATGHLLRALSRAYDCSIQLSYDHLPSIRTTQHFVRRGIPIHDPSTHTQDHDLRE